MSLRVGQVSKKCLTSSISSQHSSQSGVSVFLLNFAFVSLSIYIAHFLFDLLLFSQLVKQLFWKDPFILIFIDIYEHVLDIFIRFTERLVLGICFNV